MGGGVGLYEEVLGFETAWEVPGRRAGTPNMVEWVKNWYYFVHHCGFVFCSI